MDPLSIAASVGSLTCTCLSLAKLLGNICTKYKAAPQLILSLQTETKVISISLSQLQRVLLSDANSLQTQALLDPEIISTIDVALTGCSVTLSCLEEEIHGLVERLGKGLGVVDKAGVVWKDDKFKDMLHQLRGQCSAINLLLSSLQMKSLTDIHRLLNENKTVFKQSAVSTESLRALYSLHDGAESFLGYMQCNEKDSIFGDIDAASVNQKEFEFDDLIKRSPAYRRASAAKEDKGKNVSREFHGEEDLIDLGVVLVDVSEAIEDRIEEERMESSRDLDVLITPIDDAEPTAPHTCLQQSAAPKVVNRASNISPDTETKESNVRIVRKELRSRFPLMPQQENKESKGEMAAANDSSLSLSGDHFQNTIKEDYPDGDKSPRPLLDDCHPQHSAIDKITHQTIDKPSTTLQSSPNQQQNLPPEASSTTGPPTKQERSKFPHAFERWEVLSAHWESLTNFWTRQLEANATLLDSQPFTVVLKKQVVDLSAAGANLFHAVVELQRLRASSERKFQRWFFEARAEMERANEKYEMMEAALEEERAYRGLAVEEAVKQEKEKFGKVWKAAESDVKLAKKELQQEKEKAAHSEQCFLMAVKELTQEKNKSAQRLENWKAAENDRKLVEEELQQETHKSAELQAKLRDIVTSLQGFADPVAIAENISVQPMQKLKSTAPESSANTGNGSRNTTSELAPKPKAIQEEESTRKAERRTIQVEYVAPRSGAGRSPKEIMRQRAARESRRAAEEKAQNKNSTARRNNAKDTRTTIDIDYDRGTIKTSGHKEGPLIGKKESAAATKELPSAA